MGLTVNGVGIAEERVAKEMDRLREDYGAYVRANGGESSEAQLREWAEENLIEAEVFRQEAVASQPAPSDARAQQNIAECQDYYSAIPEGERLARSKEGLCVKALEKEIRKRVPKVSEADARREYDAHPELFVSSETLRLSHICRLIGPGCASRAEAYLELLRIRTDLASHQVNWFDVMSTSDTYRHDYGVFSPVTRGNLPEEIEAKLFALALGEVSDVIEFDGQSLHLFRVLAKDPPEKLRFQEVREHLQEAMFERGYHAALEKMFDDLKAKAVIRREA